MESVVPQGKTYVVLDAKGSQIATYPAGTQPVMLQRGNGETASGETTTDCVEVTCPSTFDSTVKCWKCKTRLRMR